MYAIRAEAFCSEINSAQSHTSTQLGGLVRTPIEQTGEEFVHVLAEDSGGPWRIDGERDLTELGTRGTRRTPTAGVGLHRARRLMQRMGGELEVLAAGDGTHAIRLTFRRA